jgi:hypothetical protein
MRTQEFTEDATAAIFEPQAGSAGARAPMEGVR